MHTHIYINNLVFFYLTLRDPTGKKHLGSWRWLWLARLPSSSLRPPHTHIIGTTMSLLTLNLTLRKSCLVRQIYKLMMFYLICDLIEIWIFLFLFLLSSFLFLICYFSPPFPSSPSSPCSFSPFVSPFWSSFSPYVSPFNYSFLSSSPS